MAMLQMYGGYGKHLLLHNWRTLTAVAKTSAAWAVVVIIFTLFFEMQPSMSRLFVVWSFINTFLIVTAWRLAFRRVIWGKGWAEMLKSRVLVVGWSKESHVLAQHILADPAHPYEIIGCTPSAHGKFWVKPPERVRVLGDYNSVRELLVENKPDILIMADLDPVMGEIVALAQLCVKEHVQFKVIPSFFQIFASGLHLENMSGVPVMGISQLPLDYRHNRVLKRAVDIVGALVGLALSIPLIIVFGMLIHRESPGPIFYSQVRLGRRGNPFLIHKLRSMRLDAEAGGLGWTVEGDVRRLKIGEFMRRFNIDEVPQFWNVLKGEMSLVGPRPERPELIENFKEEITHYNARHFAKPGITGYAQVNGMRGNTSLTERIRYDLYYLENWTVFLDFYIMLKTFFVRSNAY
jgi:exopolysaccharide biosynthesis polyprenyl glycosylphosphotransferase